MAAVFVAALAAHLLAHTRRPVVTQVQDLAQGVVAATRIGVVRHGTVLQWAQATGELPGWSHFQQYETPNALANAVSGEEVDVGLHDGPELEYMVNTGRCDLTVVGQEFNIQGYVFFVARNSLLGPTLSRGIALAKESGRLSEASYKTRFDNGDICSSTRHVDPLKTQGEPHSMSFDNIWGAILLCELLLAISVCVHVGRLVHNHILAKRSADQVPGVNLFFQKRLQSDVDTGSQGVDTESKGDASPKAGSEGNKPTKGKQQLIIAEPAFTRDAPLLFPHPANAAAVGKAGLLDSSISRANDGSGDQGAEDPMNEGPMSPYDVVDQIDLQ